MFTGIVEETGTVESIRKGSGAFKLTVKCSRVLGNNTGAHENDREGFDVFEAPTAIGDSIAVNGICLTVTELTESTFTADVMPETLSRTSLSGARPGTRVNLERAMPAYGRFGGHIVSGHIDGTGKITDIHKDGNAVWYTISAGNEIMSLIVEKGSVAIDGISLTVAKVSRGSFSVSIIPHTIEETILPDKKIGSSVNLETDVVGKYVKKLINHDNAEEDDDTTSDKRLLDLL